MFQLKNEVMYCWFVEAWLRWTRDVEEREKKQIEQYGSIL
jgi:hypothetical protein